MATNDSTAGVKLQAKIDAYEGWVLARLLKRTGWQNHDLCRTIVREWIASKGEHLRMEYGISRDEWERETGGNVRPIDKGRKSPRNREPRA